MPIILTGLSRFPEEHFLFELDLSERGHLQFDDGDFKFTERAKQAQAAKWVRMFAIWGPRKTIKREWLATGGVGDEAIPHLAYGWAYKRPFLWAYLERRRVSIWLSDHFAKILGKPTICYGELSGQEKRDRDLMEYLDGVSRSIVVEDLRLRSGAELGWAQPFTNKYDGVLVLYTNYNMEKRAIEIDGKSEYGFNEAFNILRGALAEGGHEVEPLWWYDWEKIEVDLNTPV